MTLQEFIIKAKKHCYLSGANYCQSHKLGSYDLEYKEDDYIYQITYLGGINYSFEETIWYKEKPVWVMSFLCKVITDGFNGQFLKEALLNATNENFLRGPSQYAKESYQYRNITNGYLDWFQGYEEVYCQDNLVFIGIYHGGAVK